MDYSSWTSCEAYGHLYEDSETRKNWRVCTDCGDSYNDDSFQEELEKESK